MKNLLLLAFASLSISVSASAYDYKLNDSVTYKVIPVTRAWTQAAPSVGQGYTKTVTVTKITPGNDVRDLEYTLTTTYDNGAADSIETLKSWQVLNQTQNTKISIQQCGQQGSHKRNVQINGQTYSGCEVETIIDGVTEVVADVPGFVIGGEHVVSYDGGKGGAEPSNVRSERVQVLKIVQ